jgi:hypothetical protein
MIRLPFFFKNDLATNMDVILYSTLKVKSWLIFKRQSTTQIEQNDLEKDDLNKFLKIVRQLRLLKLLWS